MVVSTAIVTLSFRRLPRRRMARRRNRSFVHSRENDRLYGRLILSLLELLMIRPTPSRKIKGKAVLLHCRSLPRRDQSNSGPASTSTR